MLLIGDIIEVTEGFNVTSFSAWNLQNQQVSSVLIPRLHHVPSICTHAAGTRIPHSTLGAWGQAEPRPPNRPRRSPPGVPRREPRAPIVVN